MGKKEGGRDTGCFGGEKRATWGSWCEARESMLWGNLYSSSRTPISEVVGHPLRSLADPQDTEEGDR